VFVGVRRTHAMCLLAKRSGMVATVSVVRFDFRPPEYNFPNGSKMNSARVYRQIIRNYSRSYTHTCVCVCVYTDYIYAIIYRRFSGVAAALLEDSEEIFRFSSPL